ncbi:MAG: acyl-ACP--UDP-N-acetylglucosamine O-acyltransferase [Deltaproteobacteria bacterium]|nr:acyl-ACP--UDP-N-acetylglucosamine O-acyltransferase [Deltaproteobacteria bacterium]
MSGNKTQGVTIHPTAIVHPSAEFDTGVEIGAYSMVGEDVKIGKDTWIGPHVVIGDRTTLGAKCRVFQFASVGAPPQDLAYKGEKTSTIIGDSNTIREFVTIHRGTAKDKGLTSCGNNNLFMNYVHVAHDCMVGSNIVFANAATLAGHVSVDNHAIVGGLVAIHQFVRIGAYCIIGGASAVSKDIPPYVMAVGNRATLHGLNKIGLRRQGFSKTEIDEIKKSYATLFKSSLPLREAVTKLKAEMPDSVHAKRYTDFIEGSKRGVAKERSHKGAVTEMED